MKELKIKELAVMFNCSEGVLRNAIAKPVIGEVYNEDFINMKELRNYLVKKFGIEETEKRLGCKVEEFTVIKGVKANVLEGLEISSLVEGEQYTLRNYHHETNAKFLGKTKVAGKELWIFQTAKTYKTYDKSDINNGHFRVLELNEDIEESDDEE